MTAHTHTFDVFELNFFRENVKQTLRSSLFCLSSHEITSVDIAYSMIDFSVSDNVPNAKKKVDRDDHIDGVQTYTTHTHTLTIITSRPQYINQYNVLKKTRGKNNCISYCQYLQWFPIYFIFVFFLSLSPKNLSPSIFLFHLITAKKLLPVLFVVFLRSKTLKMEFNAFVFWCIDFIYISFEQQVCLFLWYLFSSDYSFYRIRFLYVTIDRKINIIFSQAKLPSHNGIMEQMWNTSQLTLAEAANLSWTNLKVAIISHQKQSTFHVKTNICSILHFRF